MTDRETMKREMAFKKVDALLDMFDNNRLKENITDEISRFVDIMGNKKESTLRKYFAVYLSYLANKYAEPISRVELLRIYGLKRSGWMKRHNDLLRNGLIENIHRPHRFIRSACQLLEEMYENQILGRSQLLKARGEMEKIVYSYPRILCSNPTIELAFYALYTTNNKTFGEVVDLFNGYEQRDRKWYYLMGRRVVMRADSMQ